MFLKFREHHKSMYNLRKLLEKSSKIKRNRRLLLNLQISCIAWAIEVIGGLVGILVIFLPFQNVSTRGRQIVSDALYFVILPSIYLTNSDETKSSILQNKLYLRFTDHFFYQTINNIIPANDDNDKELDSVNKFCDSCGENLQEVDHKEHCTPFKNYPLTNIFH